MLVDSILFYLSNCLLILYYWLYVIILRASGFQHLFLQKITLTLISKLRVYYKIVLQNNKISFNFWDITKFCKKIPMQQYGIKNFQGQFYRNLKKSLEIYFLLYFYNDLNQICRICTFQYYKKLNGCGFFKKSQEKIMTEVLKKINIFCLFFI